MSLIPAGPHGLFRQELPPEFSHVELVASTYAPGIFAVNVMSSDEPFLLYTFASYDFETGGTQWTAVAVGPRLRYAPQDVLDYIGAYSGNNFHRDTPYPNARQKVAIRKLLTEHGFYPYNGKSSATFGCLAIDQRTRAATPYRLTAESAAWLDDNDTQLEGPSWRCRLLVQEHAAMIWGA